MKHKLKILFVLIPFLIISAVTFSQEKKNLSLPEAIELGLQNSKHLQIADARISEATAISRQAKDSRLPDFKLTGSYLRLGSANIDLASKSNGSSPKEASPSQAMYGMANLSLPVYAGGRIRFGIESAKLLEKATRLDADNEREQVIYNIANAYMNLYKADAAAMVVKENLEASRARDNNFSRLEENGLLARNDLLKAQLQTSNTELLLLDAENDRKLANINMNLLLGLPENLELAVDTGIIDMTSAIGTFEGFETAALQNRKDIQAGSTRIKALAFNSRSAKAEAYPTLALTGGYIAAKIPGVVTITNAVNIGIGIQYNLASLWKTNTKLAQAKAREQEAIASHALLNDQVRLAVNKDYQDYLLSKKKIQVYEKSLEQATENFRITNNKYVNNLVSITDLLDADQALLQARLNRQLAKADAVLAEKKILLTAGQLTK